jgi:hypothetical protein
MLQFLVTTKVFPGLVIPFTLVAEAIKSSETPVLARATQRHIPGNSTLHSHSVKTQNLTEGDFFISLSIQTCPASFLQDVHLELSTGAKLQGMIIYLHLVLRP